MTQPYVLHKGRFEWILPVYPDEHFDSIVTNPPYGLRFMGKAWDYLVPSAASWRHAYRVLKPGGYLLAFASARTYHHMAMNIELAGFEIRDQIMWIYSTGFPKSHNLEEQFEGWGTALKPAHEPIVVARKPLIGTVQRNMELYHTGAMNIAACKIPGEPWKFGNQPKLSGGRYQPGQLTPKERHASNLEGGHDGRWPANIVHDGSDEVLQNFPWTKSGTGAIKKESMAWYTPNAYGKESRPAGTEMISYGDEGSAARFFYCGKASPTDRDEGLPEGMTNTHPTVKPTSLMRWCVRLVTPPGGTTLDLCCGSGSTGKASMLEHINFVGIDMENVTIADYRIRWAINNRNNQTKLF
jgi:hypothetical protein